MKKSRFASVVLTALGLLFIYPLIVTLVSSFMSEMEISLNYTNQVSLFDLAQNITTHYLNMPLIPREVSLSQYKSVLFLQPTFLLLLLNSVKLTLPVVAGQAVVSLLAAYGFTAWRWKFKDVVFSFYVLVMLMPLQAVIVPNYIIADMLGLKDSYLAIILPGVFAPFGVFLLRQSLKSIPDAYFEAARIDGGGHFYIFLHIVLPQMKSGLAALSMLTFIEYWNLVDQAAVFIKDYFREPLSVYLSRMASGRTGLIFAASCVYLFFPLWFLVMGQKDLEIGIELSGVK
ncbi:MAG: carbohydrate ABC transporter permease [Clostridiales bacterium]|nr:carbohydrate ABC transporter permease [Clostridiales bacterium]